jgi:hypothetical protein
VNNYPPNDYPRNWKDIATAVKDAAGWKCERCEHPHDVATFHVLTVHHLDGNKANCAKWNLAALCQRCHLTIQGRIRMGQMFMREILPVSEWFKPHLEGYLLEMSKEKTGDVVYGFACNACGNCWNDTFDGSTPTHSRFRDCPVCGVTAFPQSLSDSENARQAEPPADKQ